MISRTVILEYPLMMVGERVLSLQQAPEAFLLFHGEVILSGSNYQPGICDATPRQTQNMPQHTLLRVMQNRLLYMFWSMATKIGMRRLGNVLQTWYPASSVYADSLFFLAPPTTAISPDTKKDPPTRGTQLTMHPRRNRSSGSGALP
jgi:hypothetical protein